ncbi:unnamed protein product [Paramecium pentaurelia]|uniref:Uncharacterized protein n=1 Tax=Paramecium pentaurelia TaxID=43138 RepID=A0A8S1UKC3_9CILI|nr:unnamed protein product [Paramecium pentaurelia]
MEYIGLYRLSASKNKKNLQFLSKIKMKQNIPKMDLLQEQIILKTSRHNMKLQPIWNKQNIYFSLGNTERIIKKQINGQPHGRQKPQQMLVAIIEEMKI